LLPKKQHFFCNGLPQYGDAASHQGKQQSPSHLVARGPIKTNNSQSLARGTNGKRLQLPQTQPSSSCLEPSSIQPLQMKQGEQVQLV